MTTFLESTMAKFLSQSWFDEVAKLNDAAGELNLPPTLANIVLNAIITGEQTAELHLKNGKIAQGKTSDAISTISIDEQTLASLITTGDINVAIEAFMLGKIRIDGDMTQVMALQTAKMSPEQKALYKQIKAMTEL